MKKRCTAASASVWLACAAAAVDNNWLTPMSYLGSAPPPFYDPQSANTFRAALAMPNATHSINFQPFNDSGGLDVQITQDVYTWRVNVSRFALPQLGSDVNASAIKNPSLLATTYDLTWPGGGNISAALNGSTSPFCVTTFDFPFPANVTDLYKAQDANSTDCTAILGDDCLDKLYYDGNNLDGERCVRPDWGQIAACNNTLGAAARAATSTPSAYVLETADINPMSLANALNDSQTILSGDGLWTMESGLLSASDAARLYQNATHRLHVLMLNTWIQIKGGRVSKPNILCMRVDTSAYSSYIGGDSGGGSGSGSGGGGGGGSGGGSGSGSGSGQQAKPSAAAAPSRPVHAVATCAFLLIILESLFC